MKTTKIKVVADCHVEVTREGDPNERWDGDDTEEDHHIQGIEVGEKYGDFEVRFKVEPGKTYYLLSVYYDSGDSFHWEGNKVEHLDLYESSERAEESAKRIALHAREHEKDHLDKKANQVEILTNQGTPYTVGTYSWLGHFQRFRRAEVQPVQVVERKKSFA